MFFYLQYFHIIKNTLLEKRRVYINQLHYCRHPHYLSCREQVWTCSVYASDRSIRLQVDFKQCICFCVRNSTHGWTCQLSSDNYYVHASTIRKVIHISDFYIFTSYFPMVSKIKFFISFFSIFDKEWSNDFIQQILIAFNQINIWLFR